MNSLILKKKKIKAMKRLIKKESKINELPMILHDSDDKMKH